MKLGYDGEEMRDMPKERDLPARGLKELCAATGELGRTAASSRKWGLLWTLSHVEEDSRRLGGSLRCFLGFQRFVWCVGSVWVCWVPLWVVDGEERSYGISEEGRGRLEV